MVGKDCQRSVGRAPWLRQQGDTHGDLGPQALDLGPGALERRLVACEGDLDLFDALLGCRLGLASLVPLGSHSDELAVQLALGRPRLVELCAERLLVALGLGLQVLDLVLEIDDPLVEVGDLLRQVLVVDLGRRARLPEEPRRRGRDVGSIRPNTPVELLVSGADEALHVEPHRLGRVQAFLVQRDRVLQGSVEESSVSEAD
jgi:hypothetical protein